MARRLRTANRDMPRADFRALVRDALGILLLEQDAALAAIPAMLPDDDETKREAFGLIKQVLAARGDLSEDDVRRLDKIARLFGVDEKQSSPVRIASQYRADRRARAS